MTPAQVRFAADGMLGALATWLRLLGYDCLCTPGQSSRAMLQRASAENRIFLTRNRHLPDRLPKAMQGQACVIQLATEELPAQLRELAQRFSLDTEHHCFTRCLRCNSVLARSPVPLPGVPNDIAARERDFWWCPACEQAYWRGSHVANSLARVRAWTSVP